MPEPARQVASRRIADAIARRILAGELEPGARITQDQLANELQTSRIPVREALHLLAARGLVTLRANSGARVVEMDLHDLSLSYQIRERIEPLLLQDSLPRLTDQDVERMRELHDRIRETDDVEGFLELDRSFHWTSYAGHSAPQLADIVLRLWDTTQHYRRAVTRLAQARRWVVHAEHQLLVDAVLERDGETAGGVLQLHIRRTRLELAQHPELFPPRP